MFKKFIERPVLSTVISIILTLLGLISLVSLPITQFPDIAPPTVQVTAVYPGANAEVVARAVAIPIEEAVNGVENMTYMTSTASNDGTMTLNVYFKLGTDPDLAAVNVQNRVSKAVSQVPQEVVQAGISTQKQQNSMIMVPLLYSTDSAYDETFLQNYTKINIIPEIQRVPGVGQAQVFGTRDYSMRVWLKPDRLTANNLSVQEVLGAIREQNLEAAPGRFGEGSTASFEYILKYKGKYSKPADYENIVLKAGDNGAIIRLKDVARVEFGSFAYSSNTLIQGRPGTGIAVYQTAGSNANDILTSVDKVLKEASLRFPAGVHYFNMYSAKEFLDASIEQVVETLVIAFILVFVVVFIFLQDFRSTLIPAIAVPVAIIGTFFFMQLFGFTINLLTLFALVLAIGIVVDDAIVVVEAVHSKMERTKLPATEATIESMNEISGAIISITLVMAAVFIPVGFMEGPAGVFYRQFAFTLAIAILISALNALTLSPALCALFLKNLHSGEGEKKNFARRFFDAFNSGFNATTLRYKRSVNFLIARKWVAVLGLLIIAGATIWMVKTTPTGFIPTEDQSFIIFSANLPAGASLDRTQQVMAKVDKLLQEVEAVERRGFVTGLNIVANATSSAYGVGFIRLKPYGKRGPVNNINELMGVINQKLSAVKEANIFLFTIPTVQGFGNTSGFEFMLQDRTGGALSRLSETANGFAGELMKRPEIAYAFTTFNTGNPQYMINIDEEKAKQLGVSVSDLMQTLQVYYGSSFASDLNRFGKYYRVIVQADAEYRSQPSTLNNVYVKNNRSEMVPVNTLVKLDRVYGPETVTRNNLFTAVTINGIVKPGFSSGDAIKAIRETAEKYLPRGFAYEWSGMTREETNAGSQTSLIFILSIVFVYFLLAAQYESYILPLAVLLPVPTGIFGVFAFINAVGLENNIYVQVGLIMLIGLLAKNAILIVQFALQRRREGMSLKDAALEAAQLRLRPILMTSFAFIVGLLPLTWATGGSALGNRSIGTGALGGMLTGVLLGVFVIPVMFVIFQKLSEKVSLRKALPLLLLPIALYSCRVGKDYKRPDIKTPETFTAQAADTASIASINWNQFFSDTTLLRLIDNGIRYNNDLAIATTRIGIAQQQVRQAKLLWFPEINALLTAQYNRPSKNSLNGISANSFLKSDHVNNFLGSVTASWEIDVWGRIRRQKEAALAGYLQSYEAARAVQTQLVSDIAQGYFNLLMLDGQLDIAKRNLALNDTILNITSLLKNSGEVTALAVQQAAAQRQTTALLVPQLEQDIAIQQNALKLLAGEFPGVIERKSRLGEIRFPGDLPAGLPAALLSRRPDVKAAELGLVAANAEVGIAKAQMYPGLNITAGGGVESYQFKNWFNIPGSLFGIASGAIAQPIFNRGRLKAQYETAKLQREQEVARFKQSVLVATSEVENALVTIDKTDQQYEIADARVDTLDRAVFNARLLFKSAMANYLEVITAQGNALQAQLELAAIRRDRLTAAVELYRALGGGWN